MYITKNTKKKDLPEGKFILHCDNYESKKKYFLIDGKIALFEVFNTKYAFANNQVNIKSLKGLYKAVMIPVEQYKLFNI
jgi:hypothetical protein